MQRQDEGRVLGDHQVLRADRHPLPPQLLDLAEERPGVEHHPVADDAELARPHDARGKERELVDRAVDDEGVPGVVAALEAGDHVGALGEPVDDLALALVAPLGAHDHHVAHLKAPFPVAGRGYIAPSAPAREKGSGRRAGWAGGSVRPLPGRDPRDGRRLAEARCRARRHQRAGVLLPRPVEDRLGRPLLDDAAGLHHDDVVRDRAHHREVVADEEVGEAVRSPAGRAGARRPASAPSGRARSSARRGRSAAASGSSPGRWRCAGAGRRRTRAGSGCACRA